MNYIPVGVSRYGLLMSAVSLRLSSDVRDIQAALGARVFTSL